MFILFLILAAPALAQSPALSWGPTGAQLAPTSSLKWGVVVAPDGAGGAVLAWEENRGRKMCCRDTRDLFLQRLDAAGKPLWGAADVRLAEEDSGEEILGFAPAGNGGALLLWHRGGRLRAQVVAGDGSRTLAEPGLVLREGEAPVEWYPYHGFAASADGARCVVAWAERAPGTASALRLLRFTRSGAGWRWEEPVTVAEDAGLHPSAVTASGTGWLACWWLDRPAGAELWGRQVGADGRPLGRAFLVGTEAGQTYLHAEAAPGGNAAWIAWSAVVPENPTPTYAVHVASVEGSRVRSAVAGQAKTQVLFIPSTHVLVGTSNGPPPTGIGQSATPEFVSWRRSSALLPSGRVGCVVAWLDGKAVRVCRVAVSGGKTAAGPAVSFGREVFNGFTPILLPGAKDDVSVCWSEKSGEDRYRILRRRLAAGAGGLTTLGEDEVLAEEDGVSPRACTAANIAPGMSVLAWTAVHRGEWGVVRAQRLALP